MDAGTAGLRLVGEYTGNNPVVDMGYYTSANVQHANWTSVMMVRQGGNVGIGTTNPTAKLQVNGNITTGDASIIKSASNFLLVQGATNLVLDGAAGTVNIRTSSTDKLVVTNSGNVGINIASPSQILHVSGNIAQTLGTATTTHFVGITGSLTTNTVVASIDVATQPAYGVFFDYVVYDNTEPPANARAGTIMTVNNNSTSRYTDTSTSDIGDTTPVDFSTSISGNNLLLTANIASGTWFVRLNYRRF